LGSARKERGSFRDRFGHYFGACTGLCPLESGWEEEKGRRGSQKLLRSIGGVEFLNNPIEKFQWIDVPPNVPI